MRAQIVKINPKTIVIKNEKGRFATVSKTKLDFDYKLGDTIILEKNGDEVYFLPNSASSFQARADFWGDASPTKNTEKDEKDYNNNALTASILVIGLAIVGWFIAFYACCGGAIGGLIYAFSHLKDMDPDKKFIADILLTIVIIVWVAEIAVAIGNGL